MSGTDLLLALVDGTGAGQREFQDFLRSASTRTADRAVVVGVLTALSRTLPDPATAVALAAALREVPGPDGDAGAGGPVPAVGVVGTGGGPRTVNLSTAAALLAASVGVPVVKSGSRAHRSGGGALDALGRLGVPSSRSAADLRDRVRTRGFAVAGQHAYPPALTALARIAAPVPVRTFSALLNVLGPFLAGVPLAAQLTGFSDPAHRTHLLALRELVGHPVWLCSNADGVDELLSTCDNELVHPDGRVEVIARGQVADGRGRTADLRPPQDGRDGADLVRDLLAGNLAPAATATVCLNAAALAVLAGTCTTWRQGYDLARDGVRDGTALRLLDELTGAPETAGGAVAARA
ncbi:hypothetical protein [Kineococcus sp. SYSU DK018]|uniref:hypothetical protein n=1 Tax=Kineococcus sp. SYSU DK018 TaxID=3383139 RepID=UPI003D7C4133